jgi:hypothetical protein
VEIFNNLQYLETYFKYAKEWNTNTKHSIVVHKILQLVLKKIPPTELLEKIPKIKEVPPCL